jgi:hypothetical protein
MAIIAKRRSGKSVLIKSLIYEDWRFMFHKIYVFTDSTYNKFYKQFLSRIHEGYDAGEINKIIDSQKGKLNSRDVNDPENIRVLIILDDIMRVKHSEALLRLCNQGRHLHVSICMALQDSVLISREMRDQLDIIVSFRQSSKIARERLVHGYMATDDLKHGERVLMDATKEPYSALVIDNTSNSYDLEEFTYTYKVEKQPPETFETCDDRNYRWLEDLKDKYAQMKV